MFRKGCRLALVLVIGYYAASTFVSSPLTARASSSSGSCNPERSASNGNWHDGWENNAGYLNTAYGVYAKILNYSPYISNAGYAWEVSAGWSGLANTLNNNYLAQVGWLEGYRTDSGGTRSYGRNTFEEVVFSDGTGSVHLEGSYEPIDQSTYYTAYYQNPHYSTGFSFYIQTPGNTPYWSPFTYSGYFVPDQAQVGEEIQSTATQLGGDASTVATLADSSYTTTNGGSALAFYPSGGRTATLVNQQSYFGQTANYVSGQGGTLNAWDWACPAQTVSFHATTNNHLWIGDTSGNMSDTSQGVAGTTNPSSAVTTLRTETAYQDSTYNDLYYYDNAGGGTATQVGGPQNMASGTSPSAAGSPNGGFRIAFQAASTGKPRVFDSSSSSTPEINQAMASGTSPSIAALSSSGYAVAFQGSNGNLWYYDSSTHDTGKAMISGSSPSIAANTSGGWRAAFHGSNGDLWYYDSSSGATDTTKSMAQNPSIAGLTSGGYQIAYQGSSDNKLYLYGGTGNEGPVDNMNSNSSPSIAKSPQGWWRTAYSNSSNNVCWYIHFQSASSSGSLKAGTSASIAGAST
jgi:hypothetical protein